MKSNISSRVIDKDKAINNKDLAMRELKIPGRDLE